MGKDTFGTGREWLRLRFDVLIALKLCKRPPSSKDFDEKKIKTIYRQFLAEARQHFKLKEIGEMTGLSPATLSRDIVVLSLPRKFRGDHRSLAPGQIRFCPQCKKPFTVSRQRGLYADYCSVSCEGEAGVAIARVTKKIFTRNRVKTERNKLKTSTSPRLNVLDKKTMDIKAKDRGEYCIRDGHFCQDYIQWSRVETNFTCSCEGFREGSRIADGPLLFKACNGQGSAGPIAALSKGGATW